MCEGESHLEALLYAVILMDWLSCTVALLKEPTIGPILVSKGDRVPISGRKISRPDPDIRVTTPGKLWVCGSSNDN